MRTLFLRSTRNAALLLGLSAAATGIASAQAMIAAGRGAEIAPFATTTLLNPDYGPTNNIGFTLGADYTRFMRGALIVPSLEARLTSASGSTSSERSYLGGFKVGTTVFGMHPYFVLLAGTGTISFAHPIQTYTGDTSFVYGYGGGADFKIHNNWKVRADFVQQHWNLDPLTLTPTALSVGVAYSIPFRNGGWVH